MVIIYRGGLYSWLFNRILSLLLSVIFLILWRGEHVLVKVLIFGFVLSVIISVVLGWRKLKKDIIQVSDAGLFDRGNPIVTKNEFVSATITGDTLDISCQHRKVKLEINDVSRSDRKKLLKTMKIVFSK